MGKAWAVGLDLTGRKDHGKIHHFHQKTLKSEIYWWTSISQWRISIFEIVVGKLTYIHSNVKLRWWFDGDLLFIYLGDDKNHGINLLSISWWFGIRNHPHQQQSVYECITSFIWYVAWKCTNGSVRRMTTLVLMSTKQSMKTARNDDFTDIAHIEQASLNIPEIIGWAR